MITDTIPEMLTIKETAERSGLSYDSIRKRCLRGEIVCIRNGRKFYVNWEKFVEYLNTGITVTDNI
jgi:hypothetical protein